MNCDAIESDGGAATLTDNLRVGIGLKLLDAYRSFLAALMARNIKVALNHTSLRYRLWPALGNNSNCVGLRRPMLPIAITAGYLPARKTANQFVRIKF